MLRAIPMMMVLMLTACASWSPTGKLKPEVSNEQDVVTTLGKPVQSWQNSDGSRTLDYTTQPNGITSRFITLGANGKVENIENALAPARLEKIKPGMTPQEVQQILGAPGAKEHVLYTAYEVWTWYTGNNNREAGDRYQVRFADGVVFKAGMITREAGDICVDASCISSKL